LAPLNTDVDELNNKILAMLPSNRCTHFCEVILIS